MPRVRVRSCKALVSLSLLRRRAMLNFVSFQCCWLGDRKSVGHVQSSAAYPQKFHFIANGNGIRGGGTWLTGKMILCLCDCVFQCLDCRISIHVD